MSNKQFARGIFAEFGSTENPFQTPNGMEDNLRLIDDHLAMTTIGPPAAMQSWLPPGSAIDGDGQIFTDGTYTVLNGGSWRLYPPRVGVRATQRDVTDGWVNTGTGWEQNSVVSAQVVGQAAMIVIEPFAQRVENAANLAEQAANSAALNSRLFTSVEAGLAGTPEDGLFAVVSPLDDEYQVLYHKVAGQAVYVKTYPGPKMVARSMTTALSSRTSWSMPNRSYDLDEPIHAIYGRQNKLISYMEPKSGRLRVPLCGSDSFVRFPYRFYDDDFVVARVSKDGQIFDGVRRAAAVAPLPMSAGQIYVDADAAANRVVCAWQHGPAMMLRVTYQPNGFNGLFNWRSTEIAPLGDPRTGAWTLVQGSQSDCISPMSMYAMNWPLPDLEKDELIYTGGNHGSSGGAGGERTARMKACRLWVDGRPLLGAERFQGYANRVEAEWTNELMASNTWTSQVYVVEQSIRGTLQQGSFDVFAAYTFMEDVRVAAENGLQMFSTGYETAHFYDGSDQGPVPIMDAGRSGDKTLFPAWATVFESPINGFHGVWMDRGYEAGDGRYITPGVGFFRRGDGANTKFYCGSVGGGSFPSHRLFTAGSRYYYHGGYFWAPSEAAAGDLDSAFVARRRGRPFAGFAFTGAGSGQLALPDGMFGREVVGAGVAGLGGVSVSATAYQTKLFAIEV
jgi:hypothetical protein